MQRIEHRPPAGREEAGVRRAGQLLRLAASCPGCGARPALRVTDDAVRAVAGHPPEERLERTSATGAAARRCTT
jgi:hypothetical protein